MGMFEKSSGGTVAPAGTYHATLKNLEIKLFPSFDDPSVQEQRAMFTYETAEKDEETGMPFELADFTGTKYGNERAKLTKRLDTMLPHLTPEQRSEVEPGELIGKKFLLEVARGKRQDGTPRANIEFIKPYAPKAKVPVAPTKEELDAVDPFADE